MFLLGLILHYSALALWTDLAESNEGFSTALKELTNLHKELPDAYASAVATLSKIPHTEVSSH